MNRKQIAAKVGEYAAIAAILFWGVPYYIQVKVQEYQPAATPIEEAAPVVELSTKVDNVLKGQEAAAEERQQIVTRIDGLYTVMYDFISEQAE